MAAAETVPMKGVDPSCFDVNTAQEPEPLLTTVPLHAWADHPAGGDEYYTCMKLLALKVQGVEPLALTIPISIPPTAKDPLPL
jgi:hypothetical protein